LEHVGMDNTLLYTDNKIMKESDSDAYLVAIRELHRILKPGGTLYLSFPFGKNQNYGWFQVFNGEMVDKVIQCFKPVSKIEFHFRYEKNGWRVSSREESKDGTFFDIHKTRQYDEDFAAASRSVVCLEMVK
jgi:ubiquinone/menaquinone biosynthesis C-methylase UbiE